MRFAKLILSFLVIAPTWAAAATEEAVLLQPTLEQRFTTNLATKLLTNWHYKDTRLDDELSERVLEGYIEMLDPNRSYFLASDIEQFNRYSTTLDDTLRHSDLEPAFDIYNLYLDRVHERAAYALERLKMPFDFEIDEVYQYDRTDARLGRERGGPGQHLAAAHQKRLPAPEADQEGP